MNNKSMDSLLNPSLEKNKEVGQPFSSTAHFILSWFGGGISAALFCCLSARKMGLFQKKRVELTSLFLFSLALTIYVIAIYKGVVSPLFGIETADVIDNIRIINQLFGIIVYGVFYLLFKKYLSSARLTGEPAPSPGLAILFCLGVGLAVIFGSAFAFDLMKTL